MRAADQLRPLMADVGYRVYNAHHAGANLLFEGAQGTLLDIDHGTYPFVTSSNCVAGNAAAGAGVGPGMLHYILGITKAYTTRVGSGPFPTELPIDQPGTVGHHFSTVGQERGTVTGRARRCGWLDAAALKRSIIINGVSGLCITKLDVLDGLAEIKVCVGYELGGQTLDILPLDADEIEACRPVYETLPGWTETHRRPDQLGAAADQRATLPGAHPAAHRRADRHGVHRPRPRAHHPAAPPVPPLNPPLIDQHEETPCSPTTASTCTCPGTNTTC
jgi:adenylosuccinate synthase